MLKKKNSQDRAYETFRNEVESAVANELTSEEISYSGSIIIVVNMDQDLMHKA